jgi:hypothetical protein
VIGEEERRGFVEALVEPRGTGARTVVLIALRADFFGHLAPYVELADLVGPHHVLLGPMSTGEPPRDRRSSSARGSGGACARRRARRRRRRQVSGLPLMQTVLLDLWRDGDGNRLTAAAYEEQGGVRGAVGRHAEAAFRSLSDDDRRSHDAWCCASLPAVTATRSRGGVSLADSMSTTTGASRVARGAGRRRLLVATTGRRGSCTALLERGRSSGRGSRRTRRAGFTSI